MFNAAIRFVLNDAFATMRAEERQALLHVSYCTACCGTAPSLLQGCHVSKLQQMVNQLWKHLPLGLVRDSLETYGFDPDLVSPYMLI
jgi:hypothetical protein